MCDSCDVRLTDAQPTDWLRQRFTTLERLMLLYVLQDVRLPMFAHEFAFRFPLTSAESVAFTGRLVTLGWLQPALRKRRAFNGDQWCYAVAEPCLPLMRLTVRAHQCPQFERRVRENFMSLAVLDPPYQRQKPERCPRDHRWHPDYPVPWHAD
jgi:hypothetical protein